MRALIPYAIATITVAGVAIAQQPNIITPTTPPEQPKDEAPRRLTITVAVADPEDLKVAEGDLITAGDLIADRTRDRNRLEAQARQLALTLQRLEQSTITPPQPPQPPPAIATPTYLEQTAAIDRAKAEALITAEH
ncbi:hypothetical protein [Leptothoe sp. PORK10 BA2]|uniref:hypothetical protein n=1 Tax=Leptothoe sp. PORK10 BA2 TaxID=3110254 RepID=UPI002B1F974A|nr:hypothetical protein [Leptothoe sp. PORK10 BA2]MEA5467219.1 hypothetical protein [Leptothoe sp. PORK10 BA2]